VRVDSEQLPQHLARGPKPLYVVLGDEPLLALEAGDRIRAKARESGYAERKLLTVESGFDWSQLAMSGASLSLFAERRLIELRIPSGKPGAAGAEAIAQYCNDLPPDTLTLIALAKPDWRERKAAWLAAAERAGVMVEARVVERAQLPGWIAGRLAQQNQRCDDATLAFIAGYVEGNLLAAYQEVQKLGLIYPPGEIGFEQVRQAVLDVARFDVFKLGEATLGGDVPRLIRMLDGLRDEGTAPPQVLWAMAEDVRTLGRIVSAVAAGTPPAQAARDARVWGPRLDLVMRAARRFDAQAVERALLYAAAVDRTIKGLAKGDAWDALLRLGLHVAQAGHPRRPSAPAGARR